MAGDSDASLLDTLARAVRDAARAEGLTPAAARTLADRICDAIRREHGGTRPYIAAPSRAARDRAILAGIAAGDPAPTIAARVGVSEATVKRLRRTRRTGLAPEGWTL